MRLQVRRIEIVDHKQASYRLIITLTLLPRGQTIAKHVLHLSTFAASAMVLIWIRLEAARRLLQFSTIVMFCFRSNKHGKGY